MELTRDGLASLWVRVRQFWRQGMWRDEGFPGVPPLAGNVLIVLFRSVYIIADALQRERIRLRAASLTYVSLLSLVPVLAIAFSVFTAFGGLQEAGNEVKKLVVNAIAVQQREVVMDYLDQFIDGANAGGLGAAGSITLFITTVTTLSNIETAFNEIWGVSEARGWIRRIQVYLPLVTLSPVLFGVAFTSIVAAEGSDTVKALVAAAPGLKAVFGLGPILVYFLLFFALYMFLPNTRVRVGPALAGGLVASVCWVFAQRLFTIYAAKAISYSAIYGSFGAVPITILWIYISWTLVLLGATVSFALQSARTFEPEREVSAREREQVATRIVLAVAECYANGEGPKPVQQLIDDAYVPPRLGRRLLEALVDGGILLRVLLADEEHGYAPARPLEDTTLGDIVIAIRGVATEPVRAHVTQRAGLSVLEEASLAEQAKLRQQSLRDLIDEAHRVAAGGTRRIV